VVTVYDLIMAQYGVGRGLPGDYPKDYDDKDAGLHPRLAGDLHRRRLARR
jgi:nitrate reductase alpha subunit